MALSLNIDSGQVDLGETKTLTVTPKDSDGTAIDPTTLTAVLTPPSGTPVTKNKADFTNNSNVFTVNLSFDESGTNAIKVTAVDSSGNTEVETGEVYVHG